MYNPFNNSFGFVKKILILLSFFPSWEMYAQRKDGSSSLSPERLSAIPVIRQVVTDSINSKYFFKSKDSLLTSIFSKPDSSVTQAGRNLYSFIRQQVGIKKWEDISMNVNNLSQFKSDDKLFSSLLPGMYALKNSGTSLQKRIFNQTSLSVNKSELSIIAGDQFGLQKGYTSTMNFSGLLSVAGVPLTGQIQTGYPAFLEQRVSGIFKFSFDKDDFYNKIKQDINKKFDLKKYALAGFDFEKILKDYALSLTEQLKQELILTADSFPFIQNIQKLSVEEILYLSTEQLEEKIFNGTAFNQIENRYDNVLQILPSDSVMKIISNCKNKIREMKKQFGSNGINMNSVVTYQKKINGNIDSLVNSQAFIKHSATELLSMSGLSRFFTKVKEFQFGQFSSQWSKQTLSGIFMSGVGGSFQNKSLFTGLAVFENRPLGSVKDNQFDRVLFEPTQFVQSVRVGKGDISDGHSHATVTNGKTFNREGLAANQLLSIPRNSLAGTLSHKTGLGKAGSIDAEISKSSSGYQNAVTGIGDQSIDVKSAVSGFMQDFWQTVSIGLNYQNQYKKIKLDHLLTFNYSGLGYSNPSTGFNTRGSLQIGTVVKKNFYKNTSQVQARYQRRNNYTGVEKGMYYKQDRLNIAGKWKVSSKFKAGLSFNSVSMARIEAKVKTQTLKQTRVNVDASIKGKLKGKAFFQYTAIGYQNFSMPTDIGELPGKMLIVNSLTGLSCQKFQVQISMQYLKESRGNSKDLFTGDAGLVFSMFKLFQGTSSLTYLRQNSNVHQLGIRSSVNGQLSKKWQISLSGDVRKNLITNQNPLFFPTSRGEIMIQYIIQ